MARNTPYLKPGLTAQSQFRTQLSPADEAKFQQYLADHSDRRDLGRTDDQTYDLRGWWKAAQAGDPRAATRVAGDGLIHRNDYWKTPFHQSFSRESQWAGPNAPIWQGNKLVDPATGAVVHDDDQPAPRVSPNDQAALATATKAVQPHHEIFQTATDFVKNLFAGKEASPQPADAPSSLADALQRLGGGDPAMAGLTEAGRHLAPAGPPGSEQGYDHAMAKLGKQIGYGFEKTGGGLLSFTGRNPEAIEAMQDPAMVGLSELGRQFAATPAQRRDETTRNKQIAALGDKISKAASEHIVANTPGADAPWAERTANSLGVGIGTMLPGLLATVLTRSAAPIIAQTAATSFGSNYADEIAKNPKDANGAAVKATALATVDTAATAIGIKAFGIQPFKTPVGKIIEDTTGKFAHVYMQTAGDMIKNVMLQGLAVQPAIGIVNRAFDNWINKKPITDGLPEEYVTAAIQNTLLTGITHLATQPRPTLGKVQQGERPPAPPGTASLGGPGPLGGGPTGPRPSPSGPKTPTEPVDITPRNGLVPVHDPETWTQTGWKDPATGRSFTLEEAENYKPAENGQNRAESDTKPTVSAENGGNSDLVSQVDQRFRARMAAANPGWAGKSDKTSSMLAQAIHDRDL
jgi:hypothetical protein